MNKGILESPPRLDKFKNVNCAQRFDACSLILGSIVSEPIIRISYPINLNFNVR